RRRGPDLTRRAADPGATARVVDDSLAATAREGRDVDGAVRADEVVAARGYGDADRAAAESLGLHLPAERGRELRGREPPIRGRGGAGRGCRRRDRVRGAGEPVDTTPWGAALAGTAVVGAASRLRAERGDPYVGPTT